MKVQVNSSIGILASGVDPSVSGSFSPSTSVSLANRGAAVAVSWEVLVGGTWSCTSELGFVRKLSLQDNLVHLGHLRSCKKKRSALFLVVFQLISENT